MVIDPHADVLTVGAYRNLYTACIKAAQGGKHNNLSKMIRFHTMWQLAKKAPLGGHWIECGCWHGHSTLMLANLLPAGCRLDVYDSFEGLSDFGDKDASPWFPTKRDQREEQQNFRSNFAQVMGLVEGFPVYLHRGWIPEVFETAPRQSSLISFASIDVDLYAPTLASLQFIWPQLMEGGAVYLDDYGYRNFPGASRAVDEFFAVSTPTLFMSLASGGAYAIK